MKRVYRIAKGIYTVRSGSREFDVEQVAAVDPEKRDRAWALYEYVRGERQYCNHFRTKRDAIAAIDALTAVESEKRDSKAKVIKRGPGLYRVEVGDYVFTVKRVGGEVANQSRDDSVDRSVQDKERSTIQGSGECFS